MKTYSSFQSVKIEVVRLSKLPINNRRVKILGRYNIQIYPSLTVELLIVYFPALRNNKNWMGDGASGRGGGGEGGRQNQRGLELRDDVLTICKVIKTHTGRRYFQAAENLLYCFKCFEQIFEDETERIGFRNKAFTTIRLHRCRF